MLNSRRNVFTGSRGGQGQTSPCEKTLVDFGCVTHTHTRKLKDVRWLLMSTFYGVLISKRGYGHVLLLQRVISAPFIFNWDYLRVSTSDLIGQ